MKFALREKYYVRYCDDFVVLSTTRRHLENLVGTTNTFLDKQLKMQLHARKVSVRSWTQGVDFLGYVVLPHCTVLRTRTKRRLCKRVNIDNLSSYLGLCRHASAYWTEQCIKSKVWLT